MALEAHSPTRLRTYVARGGMTVRITKKIPKRLKESELSAAARLSLSSSIAVAMADEFAPNTTPQVTKSSIGDDKLVLNFTDCTVQTSRVSSPV